jgi:antitoxin component YwqK of YwqJK toxin-antitoxin module
MKKPQDQPKPPTKTIHYEDKSKYIGTFADNNIKHGVGVMLYSDSTKYEGEWRFDRPHGYGKKSYQGNSTYEGKFSKGLRDGEGIMYWPSSKIWYQGAWKSDEYNGSGIEYYQNGNLWYDGSWKNGEYSGYGRKYDQTGKLLCKGIWSSHKLRSIKENNHKTVGWQSQTDIQNEEIYFGQLNKHSKKHGNPIPPTQ